VGTMKLCPPLWQHGNMALAPQRSMKMLEVHFHKTCMPTGLLLCSFPRSCVGMHHYPLISPSLLLHVDALSFCFHPGNPPCIPTQERGNEEQCLTRITVSMSVESLCAGIYVVMRSRVKLIPFLAASRPSLPHTRCLSSRLRASAGGRTPTHPGPLHFLTFIIPLRLLKFARGLCREDTLRVCREIAVSFHKPRNRLS
jgi:hypothetical protein